MTKRISFWALLGFLVACCWVLISFVGAPDLNLGRWTVVAVTAPASLIGRAIPLAYYWFIVLNAAIYALVGLATEVARRQILRHP